MTSFSGSKLTGLFSPLALILSFLCLFETVQGVVHDVDIVNFTFDPDSVDVSPGDTVRWTLVNGTHTASSLPASPKIWDSGTMNIGGQTFETQFTLVDGYGAFPYKCNFHATMQAVVTMTPPAPPAVISVLVADGFFEPVYVTSPPGDSTRLFVVEQAGKIQIIPIGGGAITTYLDITAKVNGGGEQGLLGLAFHPNYPDSPYVYVNYTELGGDTRIARYSTTSGDPNTADGSSEKIILEVSQPFSNHNAGMLEFGPDGYLYVGLGDGGAAGDPGTRAQNTAELLGKMLRLDINTASPYLIPGDNPFTGDGATLDEIWAIGMRNPWRWSFDRATGDLILPDVGQDVWEEINFEEAGSGGGFNYGWNLKEGTICYEPETNCDPGGITTDPIYVYQHAGGQCSITGGYMYRGCAMPDMDGFYIFGDYCTGDIWAVLLGVGGPPAKILDAGNNVLSSFGEDYYGELYYCDLGAGAVFKIIPDGVPSQCSVGGGCCGEFTSGFPGNTNCDSEGKRNLADITRLIDHVYISKADLCCQENGNVNSDAEDKRNLADITRLIDHVYISKVETEACL